MRSSKARLTIVVLATSLVFAQTAPPAFEVTSVHSAAPLPPQEGEPKATLSHVRTMPGKVAMRNIGLTEAIAWAYDLEWYQISGPSWLPETHFDIDAKVDRPAPNDEMRAMTQALLANRFGLKAHREDKDLSCVAITVGKDGPKFKASEDLGESTFEPTPKTMTIKMTHMSMRMMARILTEAMGKPVVDLTGLNGTFDFTLDGRNYASPDDPGQSDGAYMFARAMQDQLGLRLENRRLTVNMLIVDHIDRTPTAN